MNELFSDFKDLMSDASSVLHTHAISLLNEPQSTERDKRIEQIVRQSIAIWKRIKDDTPSVEGLPDEGSLGHPSPWYFLKRSSQDLRPTTRGTAF